MTGPASHRPPSDKGAVQTFPYLCPSKKHSEKKTLVMCRYKAIVSDLDGTLFDADSRITPRTAAALRAAAQAGLKIILATGRHHTDLRGIAEKGLGIPVYRVSENGGVVFSPQEERLVYHPMAPDIVRRLTEVMAEAPREVYLHLYKGERWFVNKYDAVSVTHQNQSGFLFELADYSTFPDFEDCTKMCFMARDERAVEFMDRTVRKVRDPRLSFFWTMNTCFEAMDIHADKGVAVAGILQREGIRPEEVLAFGDGLNDLNMLRLAGKGIVMGNAVPQLAEALPHNERIGTNREEAVAQYIEQHVLNGK